MFKEPRKIILLPLTVIFLVGLCVLWMMPLWPRSFWWLADLIGFSPLWVLFLPVFILMLFAILRKEWRGCFINAISAGVIFFGIMGFNIPSPASVPVDSASLILKIITINMGGVDNPEAFFRMVLIEKPDLIVFQELYKPIEVPLRSRLEQQGWDLQLRGYIGLASRFKIHSIAEKARKPLGGRGDILVQYGIETPQGLVYLVDVHLETPRLGVEAFLDHRADAISEMEKIKDLQEQESLHAAMTAYPLKGAIVAGDFNLTRANPLFAAYWSGYKDAFVDKGFGVGYTKHTRWHGARIDHILLDRGWDTLEARVGDDIGGDHHPVIARIVHAGILLPIHNEIAPQTAETSALPEKVDPGTGVMLKEWSLDMFPLLHFTYTIMPGTPVLMRVQTSWGDWVCLGGTTAGQCPAAMIPEKIILADDGKSHDITINVRSAVRALLPGINVLTQLTFTDPQLDALPPGARVDGLRISARDK